MDNQETIGYLSRITNANKYLVKVGLKGLEPPEIQRPPPDSEPYQGPLRAAIAGKAFKALLAWICRIESGSC